MAIVCGYPDFHTCQCGFTTVEELEAHVTVEHYQLSIYECENQEVLVILSNYN
jgi:hypothetical protein